MAAREIAPVNSEQEVRLLPREEDLKCKFTHPWNFDYGTDDIDGLESEVRQSIRHMITFSHQIGGSEYGGYEPDENLGKKLNIAWFQKNGLLKPLVMQFEGDIDAAIKFAWPDGFAKWYEKPAEKKFSAPPDSVEFWQELKKDLGDIEPEKMTARNFISTYDHKTDFKAGYWYTPGKYFYLIYSRDALPNPAEYLTKGFTPPSEQPEFVKLVDEARELMEAKFKKSPGWMKEAAEKIGDPEFWDAFKADLDSLKENLSFDQFTLGFTSPDVAYKPYIVNGKYRYIYYAIRNNQLKTAETDDATSSSKPPHQLFYESAPIDMKLLLIAKFPKQFGRFALDTITEQGNLPQEALSILGSIGILSHDTKENILNSLATYLTTKNPTLQHFSNSEVRVMLDHLGRKLQSETRDRDPLSLETMVSNNSFIADILREAQSGEESPKVDAAKDLIASLKDFYYMPVLKSLLYKPAALYWTFYLRENHKNTVPSTALKQFLQVFCVDKLKGTPDPNSQEVLKFIRGQVLPDIFNHFAEIAEFAPQIQFFRQEGLDGNPKHLFLHQVEGIKQLIETRGGILSDEPGTGKTLILALAALNLITKEKGDKSGGRIMVVGTNSVIGNWEGELKQHIDMDQNDIGLVNVNFTQEDNSEQTKQELRKRLDRLERSLQLGEHMKQFVLVNYDLFRNPGFKQILAKYSMDVLEIDEAHNIKSRFPEAIEEADSARVAQRTSGLYRYIESNPDMARFFATSTPFVKDLVETLVMGHLAKPDLVPINKVRELMFDPVATHKLLRQVMIRRKKEEIADLPLKETTFIPIDLKSMSEQEKAEFITVANGLIERSPNPFSMLYSLLTLEGLAKYPWLTDKVQELLRDGRKVVIFTPFVSEEGKLTSAISTARITEKLRQVGIDSVGILNGEMKEVDRIAVQNDFKRRDGIKVLVGNYLTAGESITLNSPETRATEVILFIAPNAISRFLQSIDRIHRFGQNEKVTVHIPYVTGDLLGRDGGTYDERIVKLLAKELNEFGAVVDGQFFIESDFYQNIARANRISLKKGTGFNIAELTPRKSKIPGQTIRKSVRRNRKVYRGSAGKIRLPGEILDEENESVRQILYMDSEVNLPGYNTFREVNAGVFGSESGQDVVRIYMDQMGRYPVLNAEQERIIGQYIKQGKPVSELLTDDVFLSTISTEKQRQQFMNVITESQSANDLLANSNLRLVFSIAKRHPYGLELLDAIQEGNAGLMTAVEKFDPDRGLKFSTYATIWIRQAITRGIAEQSRTIRIPVHMHEALGTARKLTDEFLVVNGRAPKAGELKELLIRESNMGESRANSVIRTIQSNVIGTASLDKTIGDDEDVDLYNFVESSESAESGSIKNIEEDDITSEVRRAMQRDLSEREAKVLSLRFGLEDKRERTLEEVGREMGGITRERVRQLEAKALGKLRLDPDLEAKWWEKDAPSFFFHKSAEAAAFGVGAFNDRQSFVEKQTEQLAPELREAFSLGIHGKADYEATRYRFNQARIKIWESLSTLSREDLFDPEQASKIYGGYARPYIDPLVIKQVYQSESVQMRHPDRQVLNHFFGIGNRVYELPPMLRVDRVAEKLGISHDTVVKRLHTALNILEKHAQQRDSNPTRAFSQSSKIVAQAMQNQDVWEQMPDEERSILTLYFKRNAAQQYALKENLAKVFNISVPTIEQMIGSGVNRARILLSANLGEYYQPARTEEEAKFDTLVEGLMEQKGQQAQVTAVEASTLQQPNQPIFSTPVGNSGQVNMIFAQPNTNQASSTQESSRTTSAKDIQRQLKIEATEDARKNLYAKVEELIKQNPKISKKQLTELSGASEYDVVIARQTLLREGRIPDYRPQSKTPRKGTEVNLVQ